MTKLEATVACVLLSYIIYRYCFHIKIPKGLKLPPGPPPRFLIGNLKDIPLEKEWETYHSWKEAYGDLVYLNVLGKSLLFVNSYELASELFETRGTLYSDRFQSTMICDLYDPPHSLNPSSDPTYCRGGFDWSLALRQPDDIWKQHRTILQRHLNKVSMTQHHATLEKCSKTFMSLLFRRPAEFFDHSRHILGAMIMEVTYGIEVQRENDPYVVDAERALHLFGDILRPGAYLVDILPFLKHIPEWFPGTVFKQKAKELKLYFTAARDKPFAAVKADMKAGIASPSILSNFLEEMALDSSSTNRKLNDNSEAAVKAVSAVIYLGGIDTTEVAIQVFFMAMVLYPDVQKAAQAELDRVVGSNSFPTFRDRPNLPYINALCKEVLRWRSVTPIGVPHMLKQDDVIGEYFVPKGTLVMGNTWSLSHSEAVFGPNIDAFNPERFLNKGIKDPEIAFGYGRRVCPGRNLADNMLFIIVASVLYTFDITPDPTSIPSPDDFLPGVISRAKPFLCNITPRTPAITSLLEQLSNL